MAPEAFGKFNRAFVTMFRVTAGDTWVDGMPTVLEGGDLNQGFAAFITSYVIVVVWLVLQAPVPCAACCPPALARMQRRKRSLDSDSFALPTAPRRRLRRTAAARIACAARHVLAARALCQNLDARMEGDAECARSVRLVQAAGRRHMECSGCIPSCSPTTISQGLLPCDGPRIAGSPSLQSPRLL
jgi:hypothetical protein